MGNLVSEMGFVVFFLLGDPGSLEFVTEIDVEPAERSRRKAMNISELLQQIPGGNTSVPAPP